MIRLCVPSKGRPDFIPRTIINDLAKLIDVVVVVPVGEKEDYEKYMDMQIVECPEKGLPRTRNWIMDNLYTEDVSYLMMMDDDIKNILWSTGQKSVKVSAEDIVNMIYENIELSTLLGIKLFSIKAFPGGIERVRRTSPLFLSGRMVNCLIVIWDRNLRFDPAMVVLDDYELSLRCMFNDGIILADGRYMGEQLGGNMGTVGGGLMLVRSRQNLSNAWALLRKKYGSVMVNRYMARKGVYAENG